MSALELIQAIVKAENENDRPYGNFDIYEIEDLLAEAGFVEVEPETLIDKSRWSVYYRIVYRKDDRFFGITWSQGATESQDGGDLDEAVVEELEQEPSVRYVSIKKAKGEA